MACYSAQCLPRPERHIHVLVVDDHAMIRQSLKNIVEDDPEFEVAGEAADGEEAIALTARTGPDLVLMDINMPKINGIVATTCIKRRWPNVVVIALSTQWTQQVYDALLQAGAAAVLRKEDAGEALCPAIQSFLP